MIGEVMQYRNSKLMKVCSPLADFFLVLLAFVCAGLFCILIPQESFFVRYTFRDLPQGMLYALVIVACYAAAGEYKAFRSRGMVKAAIRIAVTNLAGAALASTILYLFGLQPLPRLLFCCFYILSTVFVLIKNLILDKAAASYSCQSNLPSKVLIIGGGSMARRCYQSLVSLRQNEVQYAGYLADRPSPEIPDYLGKCSDLNPLLAGQQIDRVLVAEDFQSVEQLRKMVAIAESCKVHISAVPVYNDFSSAFTLPSVFGGIQMVDLSMCQTCEIMGVNIAVTDMSKTRSLIEEQLEQWRGKYICVANVHTTVTAYEDTGYRRIQNNAVMALPDGGPLSRFCRKQGYAEARRVTGPDLMKEILKISAEKGWRHYFYGSTQKTLDLMKTKLEERYPGVPIAGMMSPPFRDLTPQEDAEIVAQINAANPDFVWVGLGAPKQERWMAAHEDLVQALMVGVGAAFDYEAGNIKRAPQWMQSHNLEWFYRLLQDPKRLFKRYLYTNLKYLFWTWRQ